MPHPNPDPFGVNFTATLHRRAEGATDPRRIQYPPNFNVLITGAGKGIGIPLALAYARAGASGIVLTSRTKSDLDSLASQIRDVNENIQVIACVADTTSDDQMNAVAASIKDAGISHLDVVIANAGIISKYLDQDTPNQHLPVGILEDPSSSYSSVLDVNVTGAYKTAQVFYPFLFAAPPSSPKAFVAMTSIAAHICESSKVPVAYCVSKIAVCRLVEMLAADHGAGEGKEGVCAYAVHPGGVRTKQTEGHRGEFWEQRE